jgi:adenylate kinase family enzyme
MSYKDKYIKYKYKYLDLLNNNKNMIGGANLIIHISGPQGSGKTTLGNKIREKYDDIIYLKDLDDLYDEFTNQKKINDYQQFINNFILDHSDKPLIITGLSAEKCKGDMNDSDATFYKIDTKYKYLIKIDEDDILKQRFFRQVSKLNDRKEIFFDAWLKDNNEIQKKLFRFVDLVKWKSNNITCNTIHAEHNYNLMDINDIYNEICDLIDKKK